MNAKVKRPPTKPKACISTEPKWLDTEKLMKNLQSPLSWLLKGWICFSLFWHLKIALIFIFKRKTIETDRETTPVVSVLLAFIWNRLCCRGHGAASLPGLPWPLTFQWLLSVTSKPCSSRGFAFEIKWRIKTNRVMWGVDLDGALRSPPRMWWTSPGRYRQMYIKLSAALCLWTEVPLFFPFFPLSVNLSWNDNVIFQSRFFLKTSLLMWSTCPSFCGKKLIFISLQMWDHWEGRHRGHIILDVLKDTGKYEWWECGQQDWYFLPKMTFLFWEPRPENWEGRTTSNNLLGALSRKLMSSVLISLDWAKGKFYIL